jgi:protein-S-isoprenylcysteine O-methyltransferase Ste14
MEKLLKQYSVVRVVKLLRPIDDYDGWKINKRPPEIGDTGAIVEILKAPNLPIHYVVESVSASGTTIWLNDFESGEIELVQDTIEIMSMPSKLRHTLSLLLPILMVVILPYWLLTSYSAADTRWQAGTPVRWIAGAAGVVIFVAGLALLTWCVRLFMRVGQGTLAPWDPTRNLVAAGPYRYVRNPMISSVALMITGEALLWGSALLSLYLVIFVLVNHLYFILSEEPGLERRFGEPYRIYKAQVPRWIPQKAPHTERESNEISKR